MSWRRLYSLLVTATLVLTSSIGTPRTTHAVVSPADMQGWSFMPEPGSGAGQMALGPGTPPPGYGNVDAFTIGIEGVETTYDFEPSSSGVLVVDDDGKAMASNCDADAVAFSTIQAAINAASDGDEIIVCPGTYAEQITVGKNNLNIHSVDGSAVDGSADTVIQPPNLFPAGVHITGNGNTFKGFKVQDIRSDDHAHRLIFVQGDNNRIENNLLVGRGNRDQSDSGVLVRGGGVGNGIAEGNQIVGNEVTNVYNNGILSVSVGTTNAASGTVIIGNNVHDNPGNGIAADRSPNTTVRFNTLTGNGVGLYFNATSELPGTGTIFRCNNISGNTVGAQNKDTSTEVMDAKFNWWGASNGPGPLGSGDQVVGNVDSFPYLSKPAASGDCEGPFGVKIDIKPGSFPNSINPESKGVIPVAILSQPGFNPVTDVDRATLTFGAYGDEHSFTGRCDSTVGDLNLDDTPDLVCYFNTTETGFTSGNAKGFLQGTTSGGHRFEGEDSVSIVPPSRS